MTADPIAAKLREVLEAIDDLRALMEPRYEAAGWRQTRDCKRLVRELATVCQERMRERASQACVGNTGRGVPPPDCECFDDGNLCFCHNSTGGAIAALPLEGVDD